MQSKKERVKVGRERLQHIIELCKSVEDRSLDPFLVNVDEIIKVIKKFFPNWEQPEDLCLDAETIYHLASLIKLQSEWVKHRSTSLYTDPFLLEKKIRCLERDEIASIFLKAWHPTVELEQISIQSLAEAKHYWESLLPLNERWKDFSQPTVETGSATREELIIQRILREKAFTEELENLWMDLKSLVKTKGVDGKISYWDFVGAETYKKTVQRAFMTSFLITYAYANLEIHPLEEESYIIPNENKVKTPTEEQLISVPIAISLEEWEKWRKGKNP